MRFRNLLSSIAPLALVALIAACGSEDRSTEPLPDTADPLARPLLERDITLQDDTVQMGAGVDFLEVEADFGEILFERNCAVCHGENGGGGLGPALAGNSNLAHGDYVVARILLGGGGMPPFAPRLSAAELGGVASHVMTSWGNEYGSLSPEAFELQWYGIRLEEPPEVSGGMEAAGQVPPEGDDTQAVPLAGVRAPLAAQDFAGWGSELYANVGCGGCHSSNGAGGIGPPLSENPELADERFVIHRILNGGDGMPAFDTSITDSQVAAIATHIRTTWGNEYSRVSPEQVMRQSGAGVQRLEEDGERLYDRAGCAGCHGSQGGGGIGPGLAGNPTVANQQYVLTQILFGGGGMPAFADRLSYQEIADVATHVRTEWGNDYGPLKSANARSQREAQERRAGGNAGAEMAGPAADGSRIYTLRGCGGCHGQEGEGGVGPALSGNPNVGNTKLVVTQLLHGGGGMPAFGEELSLHQLAAVSTYLRTSWGNDFGEITADQVEMLRQRPTRARAGSG